MLWLWQTIIMHYIPHTMIKELMTYDDRNFLGCKWILNSAKYTRVIKVDSIQMSSENGQLSVILS